MTQPDITNELADALAKHFVQRKDVLAVQVADGGYRPIRQPWKRRDFRNHVRGYSTHGHYTVDADGLTKVIVFDIDLNKEGSWTEYPDASTIDPDVDLPSSDEFAQMSKSHDINPREAWLTPGHPARPWLRTKLRGMVELLSSSIVLQTGLRTASAYSGAKGCHVYAFFDEPTDAAVARAAAQLVLEHAGKRLDARHRFEMHGTNFYRHTDVDMFTTLGPLTVEVFPKQSSVTDLGNLVRLPLGVNQKNKKGQTFFLDQTAAHDQLRPHPDPLGLLKSGDPFQ